MIWIVEAESLSAPVTMCAFTEEAKAIEYISNSAWPGIYTIREIPLNPFSGDVPF